VPPEAREGIRGLNPEAVQSAPMMGAAMAMQAADVAPTASQVAAVAKARADAASVIKRWNALKTTGLAALNAKRRKAGEAPIGIPPTS